MKILNNIHLKLLALLAAIILWFVVITVENTIYVFPQNLDIQVRNLGPNLSLANDLPEVKLFLRVSKEDLKSLTPNDFNVFIDLAGTEAGERIAQIQATTTSVQTRILKIEPSEVALKLSPVTEKEVEVQVNVVGEPRTGYIVSEVEAANQTVKVSGAQSLLESIDHVVAELLLDGTETGEMNQTVMLTFDDENEVESGLVQIIPEQIIIRASITSEIAEKEVRIMPKFNNENDGLLWLERISISPETVIVQGREEALNEIESVETTGIETSVLARSGEVQVGLTVPDGVSLLEPDQIITIADTQSGQEEEPDNNQPTI